MGVQHSNNVNAGNGVQVYEGGEKAAFLFVRAGDADALNALLHVYLLHKAPTVDIGHAVPSPDRTVGDCVIHDDGIRMTLQAVDPADWNNGSGMLGLSLDIVWGQTSPAWRRIAVETGCVWACLVTERQYRRAVAFDGSKRLVDVVKMPPVPVLKLDTVDRK